MRNSGSGAQVEAGLGRGANQGRTWAMSRQGSRGPLACLRVVPGTAASKPVVKKQAPAAKPNSPQAEQSQGR